MVTNLYLRFPETVQLPEISAKHVIPKILKIFQLFGFPKLIQSDNGAPFNGNEWEEFSKAHNIKHYLCTPNELNNVVENFMKSLTKSEELLV